MELFGTSANVAFLRIYQRRYAAGSGWGTAIRIQKGVPFQISSAEAAGFKPLRGAARWGLFGQSAKVLRVYPTARK